MRGSQVVEVGGWALGTEGGRIPAFTSTLPLPFPSTTKTLKQPNTRDEVTHDEVQAGGRKRQANTNSEPS